MQVFPREVAPGRLLSCQSRKTLGKQHNCNITKYGLRLYSIFNLNVLVDMARCMLSLKLQTSRNIKIGVFLFAKTTLCKLLRMDDILKETTFAIN